MSKLRCHISISADGFVAGPNQSEENPLGEGGERLHDWIVPLAAWREAHDKPGGEVNASARIVEESRENIGAGVMGRNMFGPVGGGDWGDGRWKGWWGDNPPYHNDVFVVTHHPREPVEMHGGTTFHFATDGIERALERAKEAANGQDVGLWGGAQIINQYLAAGLLDELELHIVPVLLGGGARLVEAEVVELADGGVAGATHLPVDLDVARPDVSRGLTPSEVQHRLPPRPEVAALGAAPERALERVAVRVHEAGQREGLRHARILPTCRPRAPSRLHSHGSRTRSRSRASS